MAWRDFDKPSTAESITHSNYARRTAIAFPFVRIREVNDKQPSVNTDADQSAIGSRSTFQDSDGH
ncbi:MAG TPA: hypothetical protein VGV35_11205 [Bryobacteraceae bacterium]|nr:hypothetical protein [Bryobacteraceae bacterium]